MPSTATPVSDTEQAAQALEQFEEQVKDLPGRWLPRADELRDFAGRWEQAWNSHDLDQLESMVTEDIVWDDPAMFGEIVHGRAEFRAFTETLFRGLPDVRFEGTGTPYLALTGDGLALPWRMTGTFTGDLPLWGKRFGSTPPAWAPTGRSLDIEGVDLYEFRDGLVSRWTIVYDLLGFSQQLGIFPPNESRMMPLMLRFQRLLARRR
jgi:SnoaL-like domain